MVRCRPIQRLSMTSPSASLFGIGTMVTILSVSWMHLGMSENGVNLPNEIAIFHRDNDQQNQWV